MIDWLVTVLTTASYAAVVLVKAHRKPGQKRIFLGHSSGGGLVIRAAVCGHYHLGIVDASEETLALISERQAP